MFKWESWLNNAKRCEKSFNFYLKKDLIKIETEKEYLSKSHLNKADYNLDFVNYLHEHGHFYDWIIIGCYYAIYRSALALLSAKGYSSKNHTATLCALINFYYSDNYIDDKESNENKEKEGHLNKEDLNLIAQSSLNKEEVSYFVEARDKRETASYGISEEFTKKEAEELRVKTIEFANKVKKILG